MIDLVREVVRQRVRAGMVFLDSQDDLEGWRDEIALDRLNMRRCGDCVLGQLFQADEYAGIGALFSEALERLGLGYEQAETLGFYIMAPDADGQAYMLLTDVWKYMLLTDIRKEEFTR